jgi:hypothetical protein
MKAIRNRCSRDHGLRGRDARNCRLGITDWGFEAERGAQFGRTLCQTNPISPFSGLKTGLRLQNKANQDDWGWGIADWGFAGAACGWSAARCAKQTQSTTFGYIVGGFGRGRPVRLEIGGTRYEIRFTRYASTVWTECQTKPICPFSGLKTAMGPEDEVNLGDWRLGIAGWGFADAG